MLLGSHSTSTGNVTRKKLANQSSVQFAMHCLEEFNADIARLLSCYEQQQPVLKDTGDCDAAVAAGAEEDGIQRLPFNVYPWTELVSRHFAQKSVEHRSTQTVFRLSIPSMMSNDGLEETTVSCESFDVALDFVPTLLGQWALCCDLSWTKFDQIEDALSVNSGSDKKKRRMRLSTEKLTQSVEKGSCFHRTLQFEVNDMQVETEDMHLGVIICKSRSAHVVCRLGPHGSLLIRQPAEILLVLDATGMIHFMQVSLHAVGNCEELVSSRHLLPVIERFGACKLDSLSPYGAVPIEIVQLLHMYNGVRSMWNNLVV